MPRECQPEPEPEPSTPLGINPKGVERAKRATAPPKPPDVPDQIWTDFLALRKSKRAPLTETALMAIRREAAKADIPLAEALTVCVFRGWQAFRADWDWRAKPPPSASQKPDWMEAAL